MILLSDLLSSSPSFSFSSFVNIILMNEQPNWFIDKCYYTLVYALEN